MCWGRTGRTWGGWGGGDGVAGDGHLSASVSNRSDVSGSGHAFLMAFGGP